MFSGSVVQVPFARSTRSTLRCQAMVLPPSGVRLRAELAGPLAHALEAGPVGIDVRDRRRLAGLRARGMVAAEVALLHLAGIGHVIDRAEGARDRAHLA